MTDISFLCRRLAASVLGTALISLQLGMGTAFANTDPADLRMTESGTVLLPDGFKNAAWIDVYSGAHRLPVASDRLAAALSGHGFAFSGTEAESTATVTINGHVRLYNEGRKYDTGKLFLGEVIETEAHALDGIRHGRPGRSALDYDAGVAQQGGRLLSQAGVPGGALAGAAFAIVTDWLVDKSGIRAAVNEAADEAAVKSAKPRSPNFRRSLWFCDADCKRTTHEAEVSVSVWQGKTQLAYYTVQLSKTLPDIDEASVQPMIEAALGRALERILEASR